MDTTELIQQLAADKQLEEGQTSQSSIQAEEKFLVFSIKEQQYAFYAELVKEVVSDSELFFIPFVPPYIRGYINRHGEPYTVFDLHLLFNNDKLEASKFLIMNIENDQVSFMITDILEILRIPCTDIRRITSEGLVNKFFSGSFTVQDTEVFIINIESILKRLDSDL